MILRRATTDADRAMLASMSRADIANRYGRVCLCGIGSVAVCDYHAAAMIDTETPAEARVRRMSERRQARQAKAERARARYRRLRGEE